MRPSDTWICVADSSRAQFYRYDGAGHDIVPTLNHMALASAGLGHSLQPEGDRANEEKRHFAGRIAGQLERAAAEHLYLHLVLVAPSMMMDELHQRLNQATLALVVSEVVKDLTHTTPREMQCHLGDVLLH